MILQRLPNVTPLRFISELYERLCRLELLLKEVQHRLNAAVCSVLPHQNPPAWFPQQLHNRAIIKQISVVNRTTSRQKVSVPDRRIRRRADLLFQGSLFCTNVSTIKYYSDIPEKQFNASLICCNSFPLWY